MSDTALLDWLNEQVVSEIYLDDGTLIDVRGRNVREALGEALSALDTASTGDNNGS